MHYCEVKENIPISGCKVKYQKLEGMAMLFPNCFKYDIYSRFQLRKSDQHPGIAFVMTVFPQWHIGKHSGIKIYEPGEVVLVQQGIPFLLQLRQVGEAGFGRV